MATEQFRLDMRETLALVSQVRAEAKERKATLDYLRLIGRLRDYFSNDGKDRWQGAFTPLLQGIIGAQADKIEAVLGIEFDLPNLWAMSWFQDYVLRFAQPITETTADVLQALLTQGMAEGWSVDTTSNHIEELFGQWISDAPVQSEEWTWVTQRLPLHRRESIARTETMRASNAGSFELYRQGAVPAKEWLATMDDRVRDAHAMANGQVVPIDQPFLVGGYQMMYPGDASLGAPPEMFIQCRCTPLPVLAGAS